MFSSIIDQRFLRAKLRCGVAGSFQHKWKNLNAIKGFSYLPVLVFLAALAACLSGDGAGPAIARQTGAGPADAIRSGYGWPLIWEAWRQIDASYAHRDTLELEPLIEGALDSLLELSESNAYPFLADVGRMRGQPPVGVPPGLGDIWRGLVLHQERWPQVSNASRTEAVITSMLATLDEPLASYFPAGRYPQASKNVEQSLAGTYHGIGAKVLRRDGNVILEPYEDSPADKAGIKEGDVLKAVDGRPVAGRSVDELIDLLAGLKGTKAQLRVERAGEPSSMEIDVFRGTIHLPSVTRQLAPGGIGYIYIARFRDNTGEQFADALESLEGFDMLALILDLRSNRGGSLDSARQVAASLLPSGSLFLSTQEPGKVREDQRLQNDPNRPFEGEIPMVVLINQRTRGEPEVVAAALQDAARAVVMGVTSSGVAAGYKFMELSDGSAVYLPTVRWYRPSGEILGAQGIKPDLRVALVAEDEGFSRESQFNRAYDHLDAMLPHFR